MPSRTFTPHHLKIASEPEEAHLSPPIVAMIIPPGDTSAFQWFFHRLPVSLGFSYLLMEDHGSSGGRGATDGAESLHAMLERKTLLSVRMPVQDTLLEKDCIYLLPPSSAVELVRGRLIFQGPVANVGNDYLPDLFLASVGAGSSGRCAVVLLPDMAARVLPGLRVVRDEGGVTILLNEDDPFVSPHPVTRSALVDLFLTAPLAASRLGRLAEFFRGEGKDQRRDASMDADWGPVYRMLLHQKGCDYSRFPQEAVVRRIHRRMVIGETDCSDVYSNFLLTNEEELVRLDDELQSTVSGFWLDTRLEAALTGFALPKLLRSEHRTAPLRVWLPHCAGGHQAYSVAMTILEYLEARQSNLSVQLFVTSFDNRTITKARKGIFSPDEMHQVTRTRRKKFFIKKDKDWQVIKALREKCIFAVHDLLKQSPFSHMDIVIESGSVIGFGSDDWAKAFRLFHYALVPEGCFIANTFQAHPIPGELYMASERYEGAYTKSAVTGNYWQEGARLATVTNPGELEADKLLLSGYVPASFLVDEQFRVIRYYGNTEPYLRSGRDRSSQYLFRIIRDELVFELDDLIDLTDKEGRAITRRGIQLAGDSHIREVSLEMVPLRSLGCNRKLVIIREKTERREADPASKSESERIPSPKDRRIQSMEREIQEMRGLLLASDLDANRQQVGLQRSNEDLQASNEEFQSVNKELQGLNAELNNMYNEILTRNKELHVLNEGLRAHVREIRAAADAAMGIVATLRRPIVVLREDLRVHTANRAFLLLFDLSQEQTVGQYLPQLGPELFSRETLRIRLQQVQAERLGLEFEIKHNHLGEERILHFSATRMAGMSGLRSGVLLSVEDVTEQRDLQRFKDDLIGLAGHELKIPATTIRAYTELLSRELADIGDQRAAFLVGKLNSQVDRLTGLTRDLMDVSRITRGRIVLQEESFDLNALIAEVAEAAQPANSVRISIGPLPPSPPLQGDRERIGRVLGNLLSNAAQYSAKTGQIGIRTVVSEQDVRLSIQVPGANMPVQQMKRMLDQDFLSGESPGLPHVSLGLYISSEIVRKHGGAISLTSEKGKDPVFSVVLPFDKKRIAGLSAV